MPKKKCFKCGKVKDIELFYKHSKMKDGHLNKCIECSKKDCKTSNGKYKRECIICGKIFYTTLTEIKRGGGNCCSRKCYYERQRKIIKKGKDSPYWNGGRIKTKKGYILVYAPNNKRSNVNGYIYEHLLIMEKYLGRPVRKEEAVHHIDENKSNNNINNLILFPTKGSHTAFHHNIRKYKAIKELKETGYKICIKCNKKLPLSEFTKDKKSKDGLKYYCKKCLKEYKKINNN